MLLYVISFIPKLKQDYWGSGENGWMFAFFSNKNKIYCVPSPASFTVERVCPILPKNYIMFSWSWDTLSFEIGSVSSCVLLSESCGLTWQVVYDVSGLLQHFLLYSGPSIYRYVYFKSILTYCMYFQTTFHQHRCVIQHILCTYIPLFWDRLWFNTTLFCLNALS